MVGHARPGDLASSLARPLQLAARQVGTCAAPGTDDRCEAFAASWDGTDPQPVRTGGDSSLAMTTSPDGFTAFVTGRTSTLQVPSDLSITAFDTTSGAVRWASITEGGLNLADIGEAVTTSADGRTIYAAGSAGQGRPNGIGGDGLVVAVDAATGTRRWSARFDGASGNDDRPVAVGVTPDDRVVLFAGWTSVGTSSSDWRPVVVAFDAASGQRRWVWTLPSAVSSYAVDVEATTEHVYVLASGPEADTNGGWDMVLTALGASDGAHRWTGRYDGGRNESAFTLALDERRGRVAATGFSESTDRQGGGFATAAFDMTTGERRWASRHEGDFVDGIDIATGVTVAPDGTVLTTGIGSDRSFGDYDFTTIAYDGDTGQQRWVARYGAERDERPWGIAATGDRVYVTGRSGPPYAGGTSAAPAPTG